MTSTSVVQVPTVVQVTDVSKHFLLRKQKSIKESIVNAARGRAHQEEFDALKDIDFSIHAGESVGLVGPNGSGKSTLLKIIGGILAPDTGQVMVRGRIAALLELGAGFHPDLTGRENVFLNASILGLTLQETTRHFDEIVEFSGIGEFIDTQVKFYSSGMYVRLAFSVAVHVDPDILLVDEVLAVGDEPFQQKCMGKIREFQQQGRTIVLVSHSSGQVADTCNRVIMLQKGHIIEDNTPIIVLGRLHKDYQDEIDDSARKSRADTSPYKAKLVRVYLTDSMHSYHHSDYQVVMPPGSDLEVHAEAEFETETPGWSVKCSIESTMGGVMSEATLPAPSGEPLPAGRGNTKFQVTFPKLFGGVGEYVVNVTILDESGVVLDTISRAAIFAVRSPGNSAGPVFSEAFITFD